MVLKTFKKKTSLNHLLRDLTITLKAKYDLKSIFENVIPRKTKTAASKEQPDKSKELVLRCPALRLQKTLPSKTKKIGARVLSSKAKPKMLKSP